MGMKLRQAQRHRTLETTTADSRIASISLHTGPPTEERRGTMGSNEVADTGYQPGIIAAGQAGWVEAATTASATNRAEITFSVSAAVIASVTHWAARDSSGAIVHDGAFAPPYANIPAMSPLQAPAGTFRIAVAYDAA